MDPAAELLQSCWSPPELFCKGNKQQQQVGKKKDGKLDNDREQSAGGQEEENWSTAQKAKSIDVEKNSDIL